MRDDVFLYANEIEAMLLSDEEAFIDRQSFVENFGKLLSQTREGVIGCSLDDSDCVTIHFRNGYTRRVNVRHDSYAAIIKDVIQWV